LKKEMNVIARQRKQKAPKEGERGAPLEIVRRGGGGYTITTKNSWGER